MRWTRKYQDTTLWHAWYAWHPVNISTDFHAIELVWLEHLERREHFYRDGSWWEYRFPATDAQHPRQPR